MSFFYGKNISRLMDVWTPHGGVRKQRLWPLVILMVFFVNLILRTAPLYASPLEDDLSYLLSDSPVMDYDDPRLNRILSSYDLSFLKYYKAFIDYDKSEKSPEDLEKAKKIFLDAENTEVLEYWAFRYPSKEYIHSNPMEAFLMLLSSKELYFKMNLAVEELREAPDYTKTNPEDSLDNLEKIPLWLVFKHPNILKYNNGRFSPKVNAKYSINDLVEFKSLTSVLNRMIAAYWSAPHGSIIRDIAASDRNFVEKMSFSPSLLVKHNSRHSIISKNLEGVQA